MRPRMGLVAMALSLGALPAAAQTTLAPRARTPFPAPAPVVAATLRPTRGVAAEAAAPAWLTRPGGAFLASLVVPGAGQAALGLKRWLLYGAVEVGLLAVHIDARRDEAALADRYRDLAWDVARGGQPQPRRDGTWGYYETMSHYLASGAYDGDPAAGLQPETTAGTYNGDVWALAQALYLPSGMGGPGTPGYDVAMEYYASRAAGPEYLWSWVGHEADLDRFRSLIRDADGRARAATTALGLVLANHLVSSIDALLVARLRADGSGTRLEHRLTTHGPDLRWSIGLRIPLDPRSWN